MGGGPGPATGGRAADGAVPAAPLGSGAQPERELEDRYRAYRRRQAARLLDLVPPEAVRPLYRAALDQARLPAAGPAGDPLELLLRFCERLLPLPSMETWRRDLLRNPDAHLEDLSETVHGPSAESPATLAARPLVHAGRSWRVRLLGYRADAGWRGLLLFHDPEGASCRTTTVFHGEGAVELRDRFRSFEPEALRAFLRSALP